MPRLIDADKLDTRPRGNNSQQTMWWNIKQIIDKAPTVDAVEVVRCRDCMWSDFGYTEKAFGKEAIPAHHCCYHQKTVSPNDYCSFGKRKDGKNETD